MRTNEKVLVEEKDMRGGRGGCNLKEQEQGKRGEEVRRGED